MNKQEYLIITFHSLDDAMDLDAKQTASMKGRLIPKPSVIDAGCGMCFSCQNKDMEKWKIFLEENQIHWDLNTHRNGIHPQSYLRQKYDQSEHVLKQWLLECIHFLLR